MKIKLLHKLVSVLIIITLLFTVMPITTVSASENTTLYFEMPQHWIDQYGTTPGEKTTSVFCNIYTVGGSDPDFTRPSWQSKSTKATYDAATGLYSFDVETKYKQTLKDGADYCVIFSAKSTVTNANPQCYDLTFGTQCYGDTVYVTEKIYENPADSAKKYNAAYWKKPENSAVYGPHAGITSMGVLQGEVFTPGEDKTLAVANYIAEFPDNIIANPDPNVCVTLCDSVGVTPYEVYVKYEALYADAAAEGLAPALEQVASWLGLSYPPEESTVSVDRFITVTAKSNVSNAVSHTYSKIDKTVTVTYTLETLKKIISGEWKFIYDPAVLKFNTSYTVRDNPTSVMPYISATGGDMQNLKVAPGEAIGNFSNAPTGYDFSTEQILFTAVFDIIGNYTTETEVELVVDQLVAGDIIGEKTIRLERLVTDGIVTEDLTIKTRLSECTQAPSTIDSITTEPITEPPTTVPITTEPITESPTTVPITEPITEPPTTAPITTEPITEPPTTAPITTEPTTAPITTEPTTAPVTTVPTTSSPSMTEPPTLPSYQPGTYYVPEIYNPSHQAMEVGQNRYFFLLPDDWKNQWSESAGAYWWDGTDACSSLYGIKWPGYRINQYSSDRVIQYYTDKDGKEKYYTGTVWYVDCPIDVTTIIFTNALDGGDTTWDNFDDNRYLSAKQTVDIGTEYYDSWESPNYPDGTESFNNMIYIIDPTQTVVNPLNGKSTFAGEWYYYHGGDKWDTAVDPVYGGADGDKPGLNGDFIEPIGDTEIRFIQPDDWKNVRNMYCHIWMPIDDGSVKWPSWKSKVEKMTDNGDGTWTYDVSKIGSYVIRPDKGASYCVIFAADTGMQTYNLVFGADCFGDTAYVTGNKFENPEDSAKTCIEAVWKSGKYGPEKKILSGGNGVVGDTLPEGATDAMLMANWLKVYYWDVYKTQNVDTLLTKLNVTGQEVYDEIVILTEKEDESTKDKIRSSCAELLGVGNTPTYSDTFVVLCTNKTTGEELKAFMNFNSETGEAEYTFTDLKADKYSFRVVDVECLINLGTVNTGFSGNDLQSIKVVFDSNTGDVFTEVIITEKTYSLGDVDHDGEVTIKDATSVQSYIAKYSKDTDLDLSLSDMDNDGEVNILDATKLQMLIAKLI